MDIITCNEAKKIIKEFLDSKGLSYTKLTAKTVNFTDLARDKRPFVTVHGWKPNIEWANLRMLAVTYGFYVEDN